MIKIENVNKPYMRYLYKCIPLAFNESMSYYEMLCNLYNYLKNEVTPVINNNAEALEELQGLMVDLKNYVDNYFDNLNIQNEIDNKLDDMYEQGTLENIINQYLQLKLTYVYNSVAELQDATNLVDGCFVRTSGFYSYDDLGGAYYKVRELEENETPDDIVVISLHDPTLVAELIPPKTIRPEIFGAVGDGTTDDSDAINKMLEYVYIPDEVLWLPTKTMVCENVYNIGTITIPSNMQYVYIDGKRKGGFKNGTFVFNEGTGFHTYITGLDFTSCDTPFDFKYYNLEYGKIDIEECNFYSCTTVALSIKRRSHRVTIKNCSFVNCDKSIYLEDVDMAYIDNNVFETEVVWSNNHSEVEQKSTYEGTMFIRGNAFIPATTQSANNLAWVKVTRNATIENNRFSGENEGVHPILISADQFNVFDPANSYMYNIVNFVNNPIVAGTGSILLDKAVGQINIHNNSFTKISPCIEVIDDTVFNNLDFNKLYISIRDNTGKIFNYRNYGWNALDNTNRPVVPKCLQKFLKKSTLFAINSNHDYEAVVNGKKLVIKLHTNALTTTKQLQFLITGCCNPNPEGSLTYFENYTAIVTMKREYLYDGSGISIVPEVKLLTGNDSTIVTLTPTINGQAKISTSDSTLPNNIELEVTYSSYHDSGIPGFKSFIPLELIPVSDPNVASGEDWGTNN